MPTGHAEGQRAESDPPNRIAPGQLPQPPELSPEQRTHLDTMHDRRSPPRNGPDDPRPPNIAGPNAGTETQLPDDAPVMGLTDPPTGDRPTIETATALPPGTMVSFLGTGVVPAGQGGSPVNEGSVAQGGKHIVYTGNWYVARSADGGRTWSYIDPFADMPDFCCDQDVVYDRARDLFLWYRQGVGDSTGKNRFVLGASTDGGATWSTYSISPANLSAAWTTNQSFDFPHLALSNNFLYIHTGMNGTGVPDSAVLRLPLDPLAGHTSIGTYWWWGQVSYWAGPVQGATTTMYFGDHRANANSFRIYQQQESNSGITWYDIAIPGWLLEQGEPAGACPARDGQNWCARSDSVVRGGWVTNGVVGFLWHARPGNGFPFPYIEAATFNEHNNFAYVGRPAIWSTTGAWHYPFVSPNARGDLAVTAFFSDGASFPSPAILVHDDFTPQGQTWDAYRLINGTAGAPAWGDYVRNRAFQPSQLVWVTSAWIVNADGSGGPQVAPLFYILGRQRDIPSIGNYWQA